MLHIEIFRTFIPELNIFNENSSEIQKFTSFLNLTMY